LKLSKIFEDLKLKDVLTIVGKEEKERENLCSKLLRVDSHSNSLNHWNKGAFLNPKLHTRECRNILHGSLEGVLIVQ